MLRRGRRLTPVFSADTAVPKCADRHRLNPERLLAEVMDTGVEGRSPDRYSVSRTQRRRGRAIAASALGAPLVIPLPNCDTLGMSSLFHRHSAWLWLLCIVLLAVRVSGAHWHLCNDGNEPPRAVHMWDGSMDDKIETDHSDVNLDLVDDGLAKLFDHAVDLPALLTVVALLCILAMTRRGAPIVYRSPNFPERAYFPSAPPRAPPL